MKVFIDTNILVYYLDNQTAEHIRTKELISKLLKGQNILMLSQDIMTNVFYNCQNKKEAVEFFQTIINGSKFKIVPFSDKSIALACEKYLETDKFTSKRDFEDMLQYFCALENKCDIIYTNDRANFPKMDLPLISFDEKEIYVPNLNNAKKTTKEDFTIIAKNKLINLANSIKDFFTDNKDDNKTKPKRNKQ